MSLGIADFNEYFRAVHDHPPFRWQVRLLEEVLQRGWCRPVSLPTASGKTAILDIALFALALQAEQPPSERISPRRICLVVDRRIVVDDAYRRARRIAAALKSPEHPIVQRVAARLWLLGGESPVDAALLRGGIYREDRWARTPLQPVLMCSTVDQVGSRLLHRGYGLSPRTWSIHAGLLGHDTLVVLDEAHCSQPFLQTLESIAALRARATEPLPGPWAVVGMTATPRGNAVPFRLDAEDREDPPLKRRLGASKRALLKVARKKGDQGIADEMVRAIELGKGRYARPGTTTLIVVNRVAAARLIYDALYAGQRGHAEPLDMDVILLTGRSRPVERDAVLDRFRDRLMAGRERSGLHGRPLIVVATQCIEVGVDLDVDTLLSEACPLDSLRQRFGRLDRLGYLGRTEALVVCRPELEGDVATRNLPKLLDPVYGAPLTHTWWWLQEHAHPEAGIDIGTDAMDRLLEAHPPTDCVHSEAGASPFMFPEYCDLWAQTGPVPAVSPDPSVFLHGPNAGPPEIGMVWRAESPRRGTRVLVGHRGGHPACGGRSNAPTPAHRESVVERHQCRPRSGHRRRCSGPSRRARRPDESLDRA